MTVTANQTWDIVVDAGGASPIGLMLARNGPGRAWSVTTVHKRQYPPVIEREYVSLHNGALHSTRRHEGTYAYSGRSASAASPIDAGVDASEPYGRTVTPLITEVSLTDGTNAASTHVEKFVEYAVSGTNYVWAVGPNRLYRISSAYAVHTTSYSLSAAATDAVVFNGNLLVALGTAAGFVSFDGTTVDSTHTGSAVDSDDDKALYFAVTHQNDRLARAHDVGDVRYLTEGVNPMARANWTSRYAVGDPGTAVTSLLAYDLDVLVGKQDSLYAIQRDTRTPSLLPDLAGLKNANNAKKMTLWAGRVWIPHVQGLFWWADGTYGSANLDIGAFNNTPVKGQITAMCAGGKYLYLAVYDSAPSTDVTYIVKCRLRGAPGFEDDPPGGPLVPHVIAQLNDRVCYALHVSPIPTVPTLFMGYTKVSNNTYNFAYMPLSRFGQIGAQESNDAITYPTSASFYFGSDDLGMDGEPFLLQSLDVETESAAAHVLSATRYLTYYYALDGGSYRTAGSNGQVNVSPSATLGFNQSAESYGRRIELREDWTLPASGVITPIARRVRIKAIPRPIGTDIFTAIVEIGEGVETRDAGRDDRPADDVILALKSKAQNGAPMTLQDPVGQSRTVVLLEPVEEQERHQQGQIARGARLVLRFKQVGTSTTSLATANPGTYDGSAVYDQNTTYV